MSSASCCCAYVCAIHAGSDVRLAVQRAVRGRVPAGDHGLGLANSLATLEAGAARVHACALGAGERAGDTEMDVLLVNPCLLEDREILAAARG